MIAALLLSIALHHPPAAKAKAPDVLSQIERWTDTLGNWNPAYRGSTGLMRSMERMHNEKGPHCDPLPTYYPSVWRRARVRA